MRLFKNITEFINRIILKADGLLNDQRVIGIPVVVFLLMVVGEFILILHLNNGVFTYTLDDAYIHLGLAENIARGHYGINLSEYSAPSSSILWPFFLALFAGSSLFKYVPLIVNIISASVTLVVATRFCLRRSGQFRDYGATWALVIGLFLIVAFNQIGLVFTGMEHSFQVLCAVLITTGLISFLDQKHCPRWLPLIILLAPLIRYEMLALSLPALWILWRRGDVRVAVRTLFCLVLLMVGFAVFLHTLGLGFFPSSIVAKSEIISQSDPLARIIRNIIVGVMEKRGRGIFLLLLFSVFAGMRFSSRISSSERLLSEWIGLAILLHFCFGQFGWFSRYEVYIWSSAVLSFFFLMTTQFSKTLEKTAPYKPILLSVLILCVTSPAYLYATIMTPVAANNIYEQQYQTRRLITEFYQRPVAINDIGLPSMGSDLYIMDIWGLASRQSLEFRMNETSPDWMDEQASANGVELAIIYNTEYKPTNWIHLADWTISRRRITPASATISIFSLCPQKMDEQMSVLKEFSRCLPSRIHWRWITLPEERVLSLPDLL